MTHHLSTEDKQFIKLIERIPVEESVKGNWIELTQNNGMTEETAEEIRKFLTTVPENEAEAAEMARGRLLMEFTTLLKHWRLAFQSKNFGRR